jgi:hypothetical protein
MDVAAELRLEESLPLVALPVKMLRRDGKMQSRTSLNPETVEEYAELMLGGAELPPVRACFDGNSYWLTDGFHRVAAAERSHHDTIRVEVFRGTFADARWDSYRANAMHGLRRTPEDLRLVVTRALRHEKAANISNCEIARHIQVSEKTIRRYRNRLSSADAGDERVSMRNGREYKIHTANIGKTRKRPQMHRAEEVHATLEHRLADDLLVMDRHASPEVRRILIILRNWTQRAPNPLHALQALESVIAELKPNGTRP